MMISVACLSGLVVATWAIPRGRQPKHMATAIRDLFTDANGTGLNAHTADVGTLTKHPAYSGNGNPVIFANRARATATNQHQAWYYNNAQGNGNYEVLYVMRRVSGTGAIYLFTRMTSPTLEGYSAVWVDGLWYFFRWNNGSATQVGSTAAEAWTVGTDKSISFTATTNGSQVDLVLKTGGVQKLTHSDSSGSRITATGFPGYLFYELDSPSDSTGMHLDSIEVLGDPEISVSPTSVQTGGSATLTVTGTATNWLTVAPDFSASAGTIGTVTVLTNTSATIAYTAPSTGQTVTITEDNSGAADTIDIQSPVVVFEGNSLVGTNYAPLVADIVAGLTVDVDDYNVAADGESLSDMLEDYEAQVASKFDATAAKNIVAIPFCATNDFYFERDLEDVQADFIAYCAAAHADGFLVLCTTEIDRRNVGTPVGWRAAADAWNTWMRSTGRTYADGFADVAADAVLGADGAADSTTYFNADKVHLNNTGAQRAADIIAPVLQRMLNGGSGGTALIGMGFGIFYGDG